MTLPLKPKFRCPFRFENRKEACSLAGFQGLFGYLACWVITNIEMALDSAFIVFWSATSSLCRRTL